MTDDQVLLADRYRLDGRLGRGGMAEVRRGFDLRLERAVAVKCLKVELAADPAFQERFRREAHAVAGLNHPGIAAIYDTGEQVDERTGVPVPFLVMELVDGPTLRDVLRDQGPMPPARALEVTRVILNALAHSHGAGIIHRDIKPSNIMLTPKGDAKVMDFGIARAAAETTTGLTGTATVIGTAHYLSPEQARGERVDQRSDLYSTACLLYELLTGRPPFVGDSPVSVAYQHVREMPVPLSQVDPSLSPELDRLIAKAMAKDPADRYQSAEEMAADIGAILAGLAGAAGPDTTAAGGAVAAPVLAAATDADPEATRALPGPSAPTAPTALLGGAGPASGATPPDDGPATATSEQLADDGSGRSGRRTLLVALLTLLLLAGLGVGAWRLLGSGQAGSVEVPSVVGATRPAAEQQLRDRGLQAAFRHVRGADDATRDTVIQQSPVGGSPVASGSTVVAEINVGPATAEIPENLVGRPLDDVLAALEEEGFENVLAVPVASPPAGAEPDEVVEVQPGEGEAAAPQEDILVRYVGRATRGPTSLPSIEPEGGGQGGNGDPTTSDRSASASDPGSEEPSESERPSEDPSSSRPSSSRSATAEPSESSEPEPSEPEPSEPEPSEPEPSESEPEPSEPAPSGSVPSGTEPSAPAGGGASDTPGSNGG